MTNIQSKQFDSLKCQMVTRKFFMALSFLNMLGTQHSIGTSIFQSIAIIISDTLALVVEALELTGFDIKLAF